MAIEKRDECNPDVAAAIEVASDAAAKAAQAAYAEAVEAYKREHGHDDEDDGVVRFTIRIAADKAARDAAMKAHVAAYDEAYKRALN